MTWQRDLKVKHNYPLKSKTTIKIGGPAELFCAPEGLSELKHLIIQAKKKKIPVVVIGAGSNILISDKGVRGLVIGLNSMYFKRIKLKGNFIEAGGGAMLPLLIKFSLGKSLSGTEFLSGIPGTLGGAIIMNAGCWGKDISGLLREVKVMDPGGNIKTLKRKSIRFSYRKSGLEKYIILSATLGLNKSTKPDIMHNIKQYLLQRRNSQDLDFCNAGCIFKNPESVSAGKLIELCGLKGKKKGGALISFKHANFILNRKNAKASDVLGLIRLAQKKVKDKFGVSLEPEIKILGK